ncbi:MAG: hypothetical protein ACXADC_17400 [Candidatus Thorarchaeota archaeon]
MKDKKNRRWWKRISKRIAKRYKDESTYRDYTRRANWPCVAFWAGL